MDEFVSEPITPRPGAFDTHAMAAGLPGLPTGFTWRGQPYDIDQVVQSWKKSAPEGGRPGGERYLRRHYFRLRMRDGTDWVVYFIRQAPRSGSVRTRWFLYRIVRPGPDLPQPQR